MSMMGPPPGIAGAAMAAAAKLGPVDALLAGFNTNPYFIGLMMLILNLGGRFLSMEVTKGQEAFFSHPFVRRGLIFVVLFIATRNLVTAFWLWLAIIISLGYLFNENSSLCILGPGGLKGSSCAAKAPAAGPAPPKPTDQELSIYKLLSEKVKVWEAFEDAAAAAAEEDASATAAGTSTGAADSAAAAGVAVNSAAVSKQLIQDNLNKSTGGTNNSTLAKMGPGASLSGATMALLKGDAISSTPPSL